MTADDDTAQTDAGEVAGEQPVVPHECGGYRFGPVIAEGGMGRIYRAVDIALGREVAIKVPRVLGPLLRQRFQREVAITARLEHPGIVPLHGAGTLPDGTPFYVMRFVEGTPLEAAVAAAGDGPARHALVERVLSVADTMAYAHREQVVHRDLKPNNVLIGKFGETQIIDWGLAKSLAPVVPAPRDSVPALDSDPGGQSPIETRTGDVLGTPAYMAPEQALGEPVDQRADVYAIGRMLHLVLGAALAEAPEPLRAVCAKATAFDPDDRYGDAGELAAALRAALAPAPVRARRRWPIIAGAAAAAALATGAIVIALHGRGTTADFEPLGRAPEGTGALSLSPSGARLALVSDHHLVVRDLDSDQTWDHSDVIGWPGVVQFLSDDELVYATLGADGAPALAHWHLSSDKRELLPGGAGQWLGQLANGTLELASATARGIDVRDYAGTHHVAGFDQSPIRLAAIAPSRRRFVVFDHRDASAGAIRIVDVATLAQVVSPTIEDLTALTWLDDDTLIYAVGSHGSSILYRATATEVGLAHPTSIYERRDHDDWIAMVGAGSGRVIVALGISEHAGRVLDLTSRHDAVLADASAPLAWLDATHILAWNARTRRVEQRGLDSSAPAVTTAARLSDEPANATRYHDLLIVAMRGAHGRVVDAISLGEDAPRWSVAPLAFVRCAGDLEEPCVAGNVTHGGSVELRRIDPRTGALGDTLVPAAGIGDAAIDRSGSRLAWVTDITTVHVRTLDGSRPDEVVASAGGVHTLAFDHDGDLVYSRASGPARELTRLHDGRSETLVPSAATILSLVRPSPDGARLFYRTRMFVYDLAEVPLPR